MNFYLQKYGFIQPQIQTEPSSELGIVVVIPCFNEPDILTTLKALENCELPACDAEVLVVINASKIHPQEVHLQNQKTLRDIQSWNAENSGTQKLPVHIIYLDDLPAKHAGVGLARKIGMDEAVFRFDKLNRDGVIACFDADSTCDGNYLTALEKHFRSHSETPGCSVYFEHPTHGDEAGQDLYQGITQYELHLRYYNQALRYCRLPYAFHTVGSSMAVRSLAYQRQGGMNKRKAGEDFYFLHKIISLGNFTELNTTRIIPSPRISDRVPFGTGRAMGEYVKDGSREYYTYNFRSFELIREFVQYIPSLHRHHFEAINWSPDNQEASRVLSGFFRSEGLIKALDDARKNSSSEASFVKRFFTWFDAFRVLKLVHYLRDNGFQNEPVAKETAVLLKALNSNFSSPDDALGLLELLRRSERNSQF